MPLPTPNHLSLAEFLEQIGHTIATHHRGPTWIRAEIVSAEARSKGYWVLEIQDTDAKGKKIASSSVMVWYRQVPTVIHYFKRATGHDLAPGMRVLLQVEATFSQEWGFRLTAQAIDPSWTLGQAQQELDRIRQSLQAEGVWSLNKNLPPPLDFTHVAVIAPDGSAGLGDFWKEAHVLAQANICQFTVFKAAFEGPNAVRDIPAIFDAIHTQHQALPAPQFDAVFVVRGGGASTGIQTLNQEAIVRSICRCPLPVIIGVGHEKDSTLLDEVAHTVLGTPSKAVGFLINRVVNNARQAWQDWDEIRQGIARRLNDAHQQLKRLMDEVQTGRERLLKQAKTDLETLLREAVGLGPNSTLSRGYVLVEQNGKTIRSIHQLPELSSPDVELRFQDGTVQATLNSSSTIPSLLSNEKKP